MLVHVHQPQLLGPPKLITAFEQPLRVTYDPDGEAVPLMPGVYKPPAPPWREERRADISIERMHQEPILGYPPPARVAPFPPLAGDITLITCAGKLIRLGTFDFSSPYNYLARICPQLTRADGYAEDISDPTSDFTDGGSLHQTAVSGPSHLSGFFLACSIGVTVPNAYLVSGGGSHEMPGGFVASFGLTVHQSAPFSRHIPPEQQTFPDETLLHQMDEAGVDMHLSSVIAWILDQVRASSVEVEDRPFVRTRAVVAVLRFRRPRSGS